ncbi:MAG TPA: GntR family transcriptional regulator [Tepidisphaeraceae bacterium]|nr:GntR family transcriptional regulator [Tepidisphaeraceae bacterium]
MHMSNNGLKPVVAQPGQPLYQTVKQTVREAIDSGIFRPGQQMPSTKELSETLSVSLVTAHRALQELVMAGVLQRTQGKGTFVHDRYARDRVISECRLGVVFNNEASLADFYHGQILEGARQESQERSVDLMLLRLGEDVRNECNGYMYVNPMPSELEAFVRRATRKQPLLVVGATAQFKNGCSIDVDNVSLARRGVEYIAGLGHERVGFVGSARDFGNSRDRWQGFAEACSESGIKIHEPHILKSVSWRLENDEQATLVGMLRSPRRPTAIFAAGYYFALNVYSAAATLGLKIPEDLTIVGVDDPASASQMSPPLTTLRQPLVELGREAVSVLCDYFHRENMELASRMLSAELIVRKSSGPPTNTPP